MRRVIIIGSGRMAPGIAASCAAGGLDVVVAARDPARAELAARAATKLAGAPVAAAPIEPASFAKADLAIETIVEELEAKTEVLERVDGWLPERAMLTTNTSSLSINSLAEGLSRPDRFAGLHFLYPADLTRLVEIVPSRATAADVLEALEQLAPRMGKQPIRLRSDIPGFLWNRLQFAMLRECLHLIDAGVADVAAIDAVVSDGLAPRWLAAGPLATADLGGLDTFRRVAQQLFPEIASETRVSDALTRRADDGNGFYRWTESRREQIEQLRADLLATVSVTSERRRSAMPATNELLDGGTLERRE
ncbi:MAG TPA: 3-hydroxyacyl-CoA dehydrogenase family protein [Thermoleophilaceae bacterium]